MHFNPQLTTCATLFLHCDNSMSVLSYVPAFSAPVPVSAFRTSTRLRIGHNDDYKSHRQRLPAVYHRRSTIAPSMSSLAHELRGRIASVQAAEKIVSALRIVAAARIRASSHAALRARPFAEELQHMLASLVDVIINRNIDIQSVALGTAPHSLTSMTGVVLADPLVQKAMMDRIYLTLLHKPQDIASESIRYSRRQPVTVLTIVTADKGFCGSYNKDVISRAVRRVHELRKIGKAVEFILIGRVAYQFFTRHFPQIPVRFSQPLGRSSVSEETATALSHILLSEFIAGGVDRLEIVYTRFVSLLSSAPSSRTLLPLTPTGLEGVGDELFQLTLTTKNGRLTTKKSPMINGFAYQDRRYKQQYETRAQKFYDISDEEAIRLLNSMLPMYVTSQMIRIVREAIASEQASRLTAMETATDNAREILSTLRRRYNKERQARITNEIIEVVTNAHA